MTAKNISFLVLVSAITVWVGCSGGNSSNVGSTTQDASVNPSDAGIVDTGAEEDAGPEIDTEPKENEIPPTLPELCRADRIQIPASEKDDWFSGNEGDGRDPVIDYDESAMMAWSYFGSAADAGWEIEAVPYEPGVDGGLDGSILESPGPVATRGPIARSPAIAARGEEFGLVWQDGRWDLSCDETSFTKCHQELAFLRIDSEGQPVDSPDPIQITMDATITAPPDITATASGYVVVWVEEGEMGPRVMAVALTEEGNPGTVQQITEEGTPERSMPISVAAINDTVVVVWSPKEQDQILARILNGQAEPQGDPYPVDEGIMCINSKIAASDNGFMVSFSKQPFTDLEVFTKKLNMNGNPVGEANRITWTKVDSDGSSIASNGSTYAIAWISSQANGKDRCPTKECNEQVFAALLDEDGALSTTPIRLTNDPNPAGSLAFSWDGAGWTALWELTRNQRQQVFYGRMVCD